MFPLISRLAAVVLMLGCCAQVALAAAAPIKLGVVVSHFTATGPHWGEKPYGYDNQLRYLSGLKDAAIEIVPIVEPGTESDGTLTKLLSASFPGKTPVNGHDAEALKQLDVIAAFQLSNIREEMIKALNTAISGGVGFLNAGPGTVTPGHNAATNALAGYGEAQYGWRPNDVECEVVGTHPLLGELSGNMGVIMLLKPNGIFGELTGIPLLRVLDPDKIGTPGGRRVAAEFYPLTVSQLGKGRIVTIGFAFYQPVPQDLQTAHKNRFLIHCVQWLANRPLD
jgi:hypothetical protein